MRNMQRQWSNEDLLGFKKSRGKFNRNRALKVKRELGKLAYF